MQILNRIFIHIERLSLNRINWIKTFYINFRFFSLKDAIKLPIYVYGNVSLNSLSGNVRILGEIRKGMIKINVTKPFAPCIQTVNTQLVIQGTITFKGPVMIGCGNKIAVSKGAYLELGEKVKITDMSIIYCANNIVIENDCTITHRCQIIDTNNHYIADLRTMTIPNCSSSIKIGKNSWICNNTSIFLGGILPDNCIVCSNSLVNRDFSHLKHYSLIGGVPAKLIKENVCRVLSPKYEDELINYYRHNKDVYIIPDDFDITKYHNAEIFR